jgi:hypothetical protein
VSSVVARVGSGGAHTFESSADARQFSTQPLLPTYPNQMISPCCWWGRRGRRRQRLLLFYIIVLVGCCCCRSSSALLSLLNVPSKSIQNSWGPFAAQRLNFRRRLLGPNNNKNIYHDTRHRTASLLFTTGSIKPSQTTTAANTTTTTKRLLNFGGGGDDDDKKNNNDLAKQFNIMFEKLMAYKEMYGNCLVPTPYVCVRSVDKT